MNDDISLIGHMSGQGEAIADKLRQVGFTTLQKIIEEKPAVLAESTGLEPNIVSKIINSAKSLGTARPAKPKEVIAERPIRDPLQRVAHSFAAEHEIAESTAIKFVDAVKKCPGIREKMLKEVMARDRFRERLAHYFVRKLT